MGYDITRLFIKLPSAGLTFEKIRHVYQEWQSLPRCVILNKALLVGDQAD
jgi:hypothetical protein